MAGAPTDNALIEAARNGSTSHFGSLVDRHQGAVRAFLLRQTGSRADADDLAQETFVAAWSQLSQCRDSSSFRSWLFGIAYRKALGQMRGDSRRRRRELDAETDIAGSSPGLRLDLVQALQTLSVDERAAISLCLGAGCSHAEAAEALRMPLGTIKSLVLRGRAKLMAILEDANA